MSVLEEIVANKRVEVAARKGIKPLVELFPMSEVNRAVRHVRDGKARFRAVLVAD